MKLPPGFSWGGGYFSGDFNSGDDSFDAPFISSGNVTPEELSSGSMEGEDFAEYMWMEYEEEFDKQVMQQLEEEALMEQCAEDMQEDPNDEYDPWKVNLDAKGNEVEFLGCCRQSSQNTTESNKPEEGVFTSSLNPDADEFIPQESTSTPPV